MNRVALGSPYEHTLTGQFSFVLYSVMSVEMKIPIINTNNANEPSVWFFEY